MYYKIKVLQFLTGENFLGIYFKNFKPHQKLDNSENDASLVENFIGCISGMYLMGINKLKNKFKPKIY